MNVGANWCYIVCNNPNVKKGLSTSLTCLGAWK
jgi:hypothetical protein